MEAFKAVEKEMKTKAFSKEGLLASSRLDPKEKDKEEMREFLQDMIDSLERQVEEQEAETELLQVQAKKAKKGDSGKAERVADLEQKTERHKWHQGRLELLRRHLENDAVDPDQVKSSEEDIKNYVENNQEVDFFEDEGIYDDFGLDEEGHAYGVHPDMDRVTSHDTPQSPDDSPEPTVLAEIARPKPKTVPDITVAPRRPSQHMKSPLPALASLHTLPTATAATVAPTMKPAPPPTKPPGEVLKYASAAAAAAISDTGSIGIAPLPPPPSKPIPPSLSSNTPVQASTVNSSVATSPAPSIAQPASAAIPLERNTPTQAPALAEKPAPVIASKSPVPNRPTANNPSLADSSSQPAAALPKEEPVSIPNQSTSLAPSAPTRQEQISRDHDSGFGSSTASPEKQGSSNLYTNGVDHKIQEVDEDESIFHLPASLQELLDAYESVKANATPTTNPEHQRMISASYTSRPDTCDAEKPRHYKPQNPSLFTPPHYPQDTLPIFDDPRLYGKIDTDALFYSFYYRQGSYQQYLAAKALKSQSWRFHKQYQTWFQRHEEPKSITEDYEQGTYRFFDYESTWYVNSHFSFATHGLCMTLAIPTLRTCPPPFLCTRVF